LYELFIAHPLTQKKNGKVSATMANFSLCWYGLGLYLVGYFGTCIYLVKTFDISKQGQKFEYFVAFVVAIIWPIILFSHFILPLFREASSNKAISYSDPRSERKIDEDKVREDSNSKVHMKIKKLENPEK
jgi:hypothetical protein